MTTGWLSHELYMWHDTGASAGVLPPGLGVQPGTPYENPESKRRFRNLVEVSGLIDHLKPVKPRPATAEEIERVHTRAHIEKIKTMSAAGAATRATCRRSVAAASRSHCSPPAARFVRSMP